MARDSDVIRLLCQAGVDPSATPTIWRGEKDDTSPLMNAAGQGLTDGVLTLLSVGADPHYRRTFHSGDPDTHSALDVACQNGHAQSVRVLCDAGANPCVALQLCAGTATPSVVSALVNAGADPFVLNEEGRAVFEVVEGMGVLLDSRPSGV